MDEPILVQESDEKIISFSLGVTYFVCKGLWCKPLWDCDIAKASRLMKLELRASLATAIFKRPMSSKPCTCVDPLSREHLEV